MNDPLVMDMPSNSTAPGSPQSEPPSASRVSSTSTGSKRRFRLVHLRRLVKSQKRSNRTAATRSYCDDDDYDETSSLQYTATSEVFDLSRRKRNSWVKRRSSSLRGILRRSSSSDDYDDSIAALLKAADENLQTNQQDRARDCWKKALTLCEHGGAARKRVLWKLAIHHVEQSLKEEDETTDRMEAVGYLQQVFDLETSIPEEWLTEIAAARGQVSVVLLDVLMEMMQWTTALHLADAMKEVSPQTLSRIRFQVAQQSGSVELLEACCCEDDDASAQRQVLLALARAYAQRDNLDQALETSAKVVSTNALEHAEACALKAELYFAHDQFELALDALQQGHSDDIQAQILLLQTKAQLLYRANRYLNCLEVHEELLLLWRETNGPVCPEVAKTHYNMGRICIKANLSHRAIECFRRELNITKMALGTNHSEVARILHEMARLYDDYLGNYNYALKYYKKALAVEQALLDECCNAALTKNYKEQMRETQVRMGRIHYKKGDFGMAVRTSFDSLPP